MARRHGAVRDGVGALMRRRTPACLPIALAHGQSNGIKSPRGGPPCMGGAGQGADAAPAGAGADAGGERTAWMAAGTARAWAAAIHRYAALAALERGWMSMSKAASVARDSAEAFGGAVGRDGSVDRDALAAGAGALGRGASTMRRARSEFRDAARRARLEAAERGKAAEAYGMAGEPDAARSQRGRIRKARKRRRGADAWASDAAEKEGILAQVSAGWDAVIAEQPAEHKWGGDRSEWKAENSSLHADIEYDRARWTGLAGRAGRARARAFGRIERAGAAAKRAGVAAAELRRQPPTGPPGVRRAMDAWDDAMDAARRASGADARRSGRSGRGAPSPRREPRPGKNPARRSG